MGATEQRSSSIERGARQPRLTMEADVPADMKTHERTEGAATVVQAKHGDSCFTKRVQAGPKSSTSFGKKAEPSTLPRKDDVLVDIGAAAPTSCLSPLEVHTPTAAGGSLPAGTAFTTTRITFDQPLLWFCPTGETNLRTSIQHASYYKFLKDK